MSSSSSEGLKLRKNATKGSSKVGDGGLDFQDKHKVSVIIPETKDWKPKRTYAYENEIVTSMRVKVLMTKEDATRLLSKCSRGGTLDFKDVSTSLMQIPVNRVSVVCSNVSSDNFAFEAL